MPNRLTVCRPSERTGSKIDRRDRKKGQGDGAGSLPTLKVVRQPRQQPISERSQHAAMQNGIGVELRIETRPHRLEKAVAVNAAEIKVGPSTASNTEPSI